MRRVTAHDMALRQDGRYVVGNGFVYFCADATLYGYRAWGTPDGKDAERLVACLRLELGAGVAPHDSVVDLRGLVLASREPFDLVAGFVASQRAARARVIRRQVVLRPDGITGAVVSGFFGLFAPDHPVTIVDTAEAAAGALDRADLPALLDELNAAGASPLRIDVTRALEAVGYDASLALIARHLRTSARTLQRRLRDEGCSFQAIVHETQIDRARELLVDTDAKLETVARDVGCASLSHFSSLFRKVTGESPSAWRARHRR